MTNVTRTSKRGKLLSPKAKVELTHYHEGGAEIYFGLGECYLGKVLVAESKKGICLVSMGSDANKLVVRLHAKFPKANLIEGDVKFQQVVKKVIKFAESPWLKSDLPLDIQGTEFQKKVWAAVRKIPAGKTASYAEIADKVGSPRAMRAVGTACSANALAVLLPCHRVVRSDSSTSGYRWGTSLKEMLLEREFKAMGKG
jgi:AraC family transcriptional regulator of adaptative response/methylated-DNA-[protein]-cysteine methyltransferase